MPQRLHARLKRETEGHPRMSVLGAGPVRLFHEATKKPARSGLGFHQRRPVNNTGQEKHKGQSNTGDSTPSTLCSLGLVVVYCRCTFLSGLMKGMAPKAARAHSWKPLRISFFLPG